MKNRFSCRLFLVLFSLAVFPLTPSRAGEPSSIAAALQPFVDSHSLAGAVTVVASSNAILAVDCVGYSDVGAGKAMQPDSMFWIASQSKSMTAAAFMMLVDEGKVSVDDPVEKYLPEFKGQMLIAEQTDEQTVLKKPSHAILVREVLSHTSGLPFRSRVEEPTLDGLPLREAVMSYALSPLQFEPGTKYQYANAGLNTAARIIEVVAGMPYEDFMRQRLFEPLGMKDTTFWPTEEQIGRIAKSYKPNAAGNDLEEIKISQLHYPLSDRTVRFPMPAGGLFSTAQDVARFCQMILNGGELDGKRYLSENAVKMMTSEQTGDAVKKNYGFGWAVGPEGASHGGAESTNMEINRRYGLIFVFMVQHAGFPNDGGKSRDAFTRAAIAEFAK
ncbi:MAG TPA: serine hydrolase domain-containing protein [Candidatus Baltobacteraceae bacterium]|nr:serine hydrolase domain-containing protein [Candidatus Baltobacteraceae bacterium]